MCLENYIGIKGCSLPEPVSGKYVNSLPGMSSELLDNIANSEQITFKGVWDDVIQTASDRFKDDIIEQVLKRYAVFREVLFQSKKLAKYTRTTDSIVSADTKYRGTYIYFPERMYASLYIREIYIYSDRDISTVIKGWDLNDGSELYSEAVDLVQGFNTIQVEQEFPANWLDMEVFFGVDGSGFDTLKVRNEDYQMYMGECRRENQTNCCGDYEIDYWPATLNLSDDPTYSNVRRQGTGEGFAMRCEVRCSISQFICENLNTLQRAWMNLLGSQILYHKLGSSRVNYFTMSNKENTDTLRSSFETVYRQALKTAIDSIPLKDMCLDCSTDTMPVTTGGGIA